MPSANGELTLDEVMGRSSASPSPTPGPSPTPTPQPAAVAPTAAPQQPASNGDELSLDQVMGRSPGGPPPKPQFNQQPAPSPPPTSRQPATDQAMASSGNIFSRLLSGSKTQDEYMKMHGRPTNMVPAAGKAVAANLAQRAMNVIAPLGRAYAMSDEIKLNTTGNQPGLFAPTNPEGSWSEVRRRQEENLKDPLLSWTQKVPEWSARNFPIPPGQENRMHTKVAGAVGSFIPIVASGPFAPLTIGMETLGEVSDHAYKEKIGQGIDPERAARESYGKAIAGATTQAALWAVLPKPLRYGANAIIDKLGFEGAKRFFLNRLMQGLEGAALGVGTQVPTNIAQGDPIMQNVGETALGIGGLQVFLPRGYTRAEVRGLEAERAANFDALQAMMGRSPERKPRDVDVPPDEGVGEPIIQVGKVEVPIKEVSKDATKEGEVSKGGEQEHIGVPPGENVPTHTGEVRAERSEQAGDSGGTEPAAEKPVGVKPEESATPYQIKEENGVFNVYKVGDPEGVIAGGSHADAGTAQYAHDRLMEEAGWEKVDRGFGETWAPKEKPPLSPEDQLKELDAGIRERVGKGGELTTPAEMAERERLNKLIDEQALPQAEQQAALEKKPLKELLPVEKRAEYQHLLNNWGVLDLELGKYVNDPKNPRAWDIASQQGELRRRMYEITKDLPGGDIYDVIQIGAGAQGLATGSHGGVENLKTAVLEHSTGKGTASAKTGRYVNVAGAESPAGQSGSKREMMSKLQGMRMGTEYKTISEIVSQTQDPKTGITTIVTKGLGEKGEGGQTLRARIVTYGTGTRPRDAPFELRDANGKPIENTDMAVPGETVHIDDAKGMRREAGPNTDMVAVGAANSSAQGAEIVALIPNSGVFHLVARGGNLDKVSDSYLSALKHLVDTGQVKVHLNSTVDHVEAPSPANGNKYIVVLKATPKERLKKGEPLPGPVTARIEAGAVGSFIGSVPNTGVFPSTFLKHPMKRGDPLSGLIRTTEDLRPLEIGPDGKERPVKNTFVGGSIRAAPGLNRMDIASGEGARIVALLLDDLKKMPVAQWRTDLRTSLRSLGDISEGHPFKGTLPVGVTREHWGQPKAPVVAGGKVVDPLKPLKHKKQVRTAEAGSQILTQGQDDKKGGVRLVRPRMGPGLPAESVEGNFGPKEAPGMVEPGNIDYNTRPVVKNPDGTTSTVRAFSIGTDKGEVLIPSIADNGRQMSKSEAIAQYKKTGQHLGIFKTPAEADAFAKAHHGEMGPPSVQQYPPGKIARFQKLSDDQLRSELQERKTLKPYTDAEIGGELSRRQALVTGGQPNPFRKFVLEGEKQRAEARAQAAPPAEPTMVAEPKPPKPPSVPERLARNPSSVPTDAIRETISEARARVDSLGSPQNRRERQVIRDANAAIKGWEGIVEGRDTALRNDPVRAEHEADRRIEANPNYPNKLVEDLQKGRKATVDAADEIVMTKDRNKLQNARDAEAKRASDESKTPEERQEAADNFVDLDAQIRAREEATDGGNIFKGKNARMTWHNFRLRDYDMPTMVQKLRVAKNGVPVTKEEVKDLIKKVKKHKHAMDAVENEKARVGWRPGMGHKGDIGKVRHKQFKAQEAKDALDNTIFKEVLKNKNWAKKAFQTYRNAAGVSRSIMTIDWTSALLRQGGLLFRGNPWRSLRIMPDVLRATRSPEGYFKLMQDIRERPNAELYIRSKLGLTDIKSPKMQDLEEQYMSQWTEKIPILAGSQRAYVYFLNRLRADTFDGMARNLGRNGHVTLEQAKGLSNFINVFTGRGHLPEQAAGAVSILNELFFAPRYVISRFQALTGQPLRYAKDPAVKKLIAWEYGKTLLGYGLFYGIVGTALHQLGATVEFDPRSSDFMKIKIGNTRWDPLSGVAQATVALTRFGTGQTKSLKTGKIETLSGQKAYSARNYGSVTWEFLRSKFAPLPAAWFNWRSGEKVTGEKTSLLPTYDRKEGFKTGELLGLVTPLNGMDIYKTLLEQGVPAGLAFALVANFGDSVNTYETKQKGKFPVKFFKHRGKYGPKGSKK